MYIYMSIRVFTYLCIFMYLYLYIYIHIYIYAQKATNLHASTTIGGFGVLMRDLISGGDCISLPVFKGARLGTARRLPE